MSRVELIEDTLRDGQLSLWATRMDTRTMLGIGAAIDRAGFARACVSSGAAFDTAVRFLREDPWKRLDLVRHEMPQVPLEFMVRGRNLIGWQRCSDDVVELVLRCLHRHGMQWQLLFDGLNDFGNIRWHVQVARRIGMRTAGIVVFTESPVHDDDYFERKTRELVAMGVDTVCFYDGSGILLPERMRRLAPRLLGACAGGTSRLELNVHDNTGLALACYREAMQAGVELFASAARALSGGASLPATADVAAEAATAGLQVPVAAGDLEHIDRYFDWIATRDGREIPKRVRFDAAAHAAYVAHQVPGGMISNFRRQLAEAGMAERLPHILEEIVTVRRELGYPPMVTPYSQMIGVQATLNVMAGERYKTSPSELAAYLRGEYGEIPGLVDPAVLDRVLGAAPASSSARATDVFAQQQLAQARRRFGDLPDEELVLSIFYGQEALQALRSQGRDLDALAPPRTPLVALVSDLLARPRLRKLQVAIRSPGGLDFGAVRDASAVAGAVTTATSCEVAMHGVHWSARLAPTESDHGTR
jgi:pyruvate/oxaloacetate carboxyltransferase